MRARIERALDEPLLTARNADDWGCSSRHDSDTELFPSVLRFNREVSKSTHVIVVLVRDQSMLGVNERPVEFAVVEDSFGQSSGREPERVVRRCGSPSGMLRT